MSQTQPQYDAALVTLLLDTARTVAQGVRDNRLETLQLGLFEMAIAQVEKSGRRCTTAATPPADLTPDQVRAAIEGAGIGLSFTDKVDDIAARVNLTPRTVWNYIERGTAKSRARSSVEDLAELYQKVIDVFPE